MKILDKFRLVCKKHSDLNLYLFILGGGEPQDANVYNYHEFSKMKNMFPKHLELYADVGLDKIE